MLKQLLRTTTSLMVKSRLIQTSETSQLLLIISDGMNIFAEGIEPVKKAVREAREANVFLVFIVLDNPNSKVIDL